MKPILEWYEELPEPYRTQAIENYDGERIYSASLEHALCFGFEWSDTAQGHRYWLDVACGNLHTENKPKPTKSRSVVVTWDGIAYTKNGIGEDSIEAFEAEMERIKKERDDLTAMLKEKRKVMGRWEKMMERGELS